MNRKRHIFGCGDIGRRVGARYLNEGQKVEGWVKSELSLGQGRQVGLNMHQVDFDHFPLDCQFDSASDKHFFWFTPPPTEGHEDTRLAAFLACLKDVGYRLVLISTTGVYGDCQGRVIDESEPLKPLAARARRRAHAEKIAQSWAKKTASELIILRVPGIYAVDRLPLKRLQRGEPIIVESQAPWTNRIHADDLAMMCHKAMENGPAYAVYNASDSQPSNMTDYFNQVADFAGLPRPEQISASEAQERLGAGMLSYLKESRRVNSDKIVAELKITLRYPNLAETLKG